MMKTITVGQMQNAIYELFLS